MRTNSTAAPNSPDSGQHARYSTNHASAANDWLLSPDFALQAGVTYTIHFTYGASVASKPEKLAVYVIEAWGADPSLTQVFDSGSVVNTTWQEGTGTFTPDTTGTYYVGFLCYSDADQGDLAVDDLVVTAPDPDLVFYDLSVADGSAATLGDNAAVQHDLTVAAGGSLSLGAYGVTVEGTVTNNGAMAQTLTVDAASTTFLTLRNGADSTDKYLGATIDPGAGTLGSTTVTVWGNQYCPSATQGVLRCFEIDPATPSAAAITFYYTEAERNGETSPSMLVYHWDAGSWNQETGTTTRGGSGDTQWVRVTDVAAYSPFSLNDGVPTSVTMAGYGGTAMDDGSILLEWETAGEWDLLGFNLYRSESGVGGDPVRLNESLILPEAEGGLIGSSYTLEDRTALPGTAYDYWIEVVRIRGLPERLGPVHVTSVSGGGIALYLPLVISGR